jgi:hypothetical protein
MQSQGDELTQRESQLAEERARIDEQTQAQASEAERLAERGDQIESRSQELDAQNARLESQQEEHHTIQRRLEDRETETERRFGEREATLQARELQAQQRDDEQTVRQQALESRHAELEARHAELEGRNAKLESQREQNEAKQAELDKRLSEAQGADRDLAGQVLERQGRIDELQTQLDTVKSESATQAALFDQAQSDLTALQDQLKKREEELHQRHHDLNELQASINEQQVEMANRQERFDEREDQFAQLQAINSANTRQIQDLEAELERLRATSESPVAPVVEDAKPAAAPEPVVKAAPKPESTPEPEAPAAPVIPRFKIVRAGNRPVLDLGPHHVRTANGYQDERGQWHLFVDYIDQAQKTTNTWAAQVRYFRSQDGKNWNWIENPSGQPDADALDAYGTASPAILCASGLAMLFYAGRSTKAPDGQPNVLAGADDPAHLSSSIMLATATLDEYGTPLEAFIPRGPVLQPEPGYGALRLDHPAVAIQDNTIHLYYTAYNDAANLNHRTLGHASASLGAFEFTADPEPILAVEGGGQMPRVFEHQGQHHLFYHHFAHANGSRWQHYITEDLNTWRPHDARLYNGIGGTANELMVWTDHHNRLLKDPRAVVTGTEGGVSKLWASRLRIK